jgi:hypothetical protein
LNSEAPSIVVNRSPLTPTQELPDLTVARGCPLVSVPEEGRQFPREGDGNVGIHSEL